MSPTGWSAPPGLLALPRQDEVHVWQVDLSREQEQPWRGMLRPDERERADRFHFSADRRRFTATRAILRALLGRYLDAAPESLCFERNQFGKPSLMTAQNPLCLHFNVAHSGDRALLAFGLVAEPGVDVEDLRLRRNVVDLAPTVLSAPQCASLFALPEDQRKRAFLQAWTCKEAVVKALGAGLSIPIRSFEVSGPEEHAAVVRGTPGIVNPSEWSLFRLDLGDDYVAAVAVRSRSVGLHVVLR